MATGIQTYVEWTSWLNHSRQTSHQAHFNGYPTNKSAPTVKGRRTRIWRDRNQNNASNERHWFSVIRMGFADCVSPKNDWTSILCWLLRVKLRYPQRLLSDDSNGRLHRLTWRTSNIFDTYLQSRLFSDWKLTNAIGAKIRLHRKMDFIDLFALCSV